MKNSLLFFSILLFLSSKSFCQLTENDLTVITKGLSEEYAQRFKDSGNKSAFLGILNQLQVTNEIAPIKLIVVYKNGVGTVTAEINYDQEKIFSNSEYGSTNSTLNGWGPGISVFLQGQVFTGLSHYIKTVAKKGFRINKDLVKFDCIVKSKKQNGDYVNFYAFNSFDTRGIFKYSFYNRALVNIGGKIYETESSSSKSLLEMKYFKVGEIKGLDGRKTGAYYFCKFFDIQF